MSYGVDIMARQDFAVLLVELIEIHMKVFSKTGITHVVLAMSLAFSDNDDDDYKTWVFSVVALV